MKNNRIFITGGAGFIGVNLVKYFSDKYSYEITLYDNLSAGSEENLDRAASDSKQKGIVKFIRGDILDNTKLNKAIKDHNVVVHLAAHTRAVKSLTNPKENFTVNTIGTFNVLEAARKIELRNLSLLHQMQS